MIMKRDAGKILQKKIWRTAEWWCYAASAFWDSRSMYEKNYRIRDPTFIQTIKDHKHIILPKKGDNRFIFHESVQVSKTYKYKFPLKCIICIVENKFWCLFQGILFQFINMTFARWARQ